MKLQVLSGMKALGIILICCAIAGCAVAPVASDIPEGSEAAAPAIARSSLLVWGARILLELVSNINIDIKVEHNNGSGH